MSQQMLVSLIPIAVILLVVIVRVLFVRGGSGGGSIAGMAVCRKCGHAFPRPFIAPNLVTGKLLHCPHCGAWAILPAASPAELELARSLEQSRAAFRPRRPSPRKRRCDAGSRSSKFE